MNYERHDPPGRVVRDDPWKQLVCETNVREVEPGQALRTLGGPASNEPDHKRLLAKLTDEATCWMQDKSGR